MYHFQRYNIQTFLVYIYIYIFMNLYLYAYPPIRFPALPMAEQALGSVSTTPWIKKYRFRFLCT